MNQQTKALAEKVRTGRAAIKFNGVKATGTPDRLISGPAASRHLLLTERAAAAHRHPRTVRTTRDGRRVVMRRDDRRA